MTALRKQTMSVDEFLAWAERQPDRWELVEGIPTAMSPERVVHGDVKYRVARALDVAIAKAKVPCRFVLDSAAVRIDQRSLYQPDAMVYCGEPVSGDALEIPNPVVVFEVLSPGNAMTDLRDKLQGYFRVASIAHYRRSRQAHRHPPRPRDGRCGGDPHRQRGHAAARPAGDRDHGGGVVGV